MFIGKEKVLSLQRNFKIWHCKYNKYVANYSNFCRNNFNLFCFFSNSDYF